MDFLQPKEENVMVEEDPTEEFQTQPPTDDALEGPPHPLFGSRKSKSYAQGAEDGDVLKEEKREEEEDPSLQNPLFVLVKCEPPDDEYFPKESLESQQHPSVRQLEEDSLLFESAIASNVAEAKGCSVPAFMKHSVSEHQGQSALAVSPPNVIAVRRSPRDLIQMRGPQVSGNGTVGCNGNIVPEDIEVNTDEPLVTTRQGAMLKKKWTAAEMTAKLQKSKSVLVCRRVGPGTSSTADKALHQDMGVTGILNVLPNPCAVSTVQGVLDSSTDDNMEDRGSINNMKDMLDLAVKHASGPVISFLQDFAEVLQARGDVKDIPSCLRDMTCKMQSLVKFKRPKELKLPREHTDPPKDEDGRVHKDWVEVYPGCRFYLHSTDRAVIDARSSLTERSWQKYASLVLRQVYQENLAWVSAQGQADCFKIDENLYKGLFKYAIDRVPDLSITLFNKYINTCKNNEKNRQIEQALGVRSRKVRNAKKRTVQDAGLAREVEMDPPYNTSSSVVEGGQNHHQQHFMSHQVLLPQTSHKESIANNNMGLLRQILNRQ